MAGLYKGDIWPAIDFGAGLVQDDNRLTALLVLDARL